MYVMWLFLHLPISSLLHCKQFSMSSQGYFNAVEADCWRTLRSGDPDSSIILIFSFSFKKLVLSSICFLSSPFGVLGIRNLFLNPPFLYQFETFSFFLSSLCDLSHSLGLYNGLIPSSLAWH